MMGTTKEINKSRNEDEEIEFIPWTYVPNDVRQELIKKLNPTAALTGNDWRMLANYLGYNAGDINYIESEKDSNTKVLFDWYNKKPEASVTAVYNALVKMQRQDCLEILKDALSEIKQIYIRARESKMIHAAETSDVLMSGRHYQWSNTPCSCTYSPHSTSAIGSHTYLSCGHGFANCMCPGHSHHLGHPSYHNHTLSSHPCQILGHPDSAPKSCLPGMSSPCNTPSKEQLSCHDIIHRHIPSGYSYHGNSPTCRINMPMKHTVIHQSQPGLSPGHAGYQGTPNYKYNESDVPLIGKSDHMMVEPESQNLQFQKFPLVQQNNGNSGVLSDMFTGVTESMQKRQADNVTEGFNNRPKMIRQYSDDCNSAPDSNTDKRFRNNGNRGIAVSQQGATFHGISGHETSGVGKPGSNQSPISAYLPRNVNYTNYRDRHQQKDIVKVENVRYNLDGKDIDSSPSSGGSTRDSRHPSSTFPMRVKSKQERTTEDLNNLTISKKSKSVPQNMKLARYRKAFRHVKVFVTYSYDNDTHAKQVLSLCKFLQYNGFACCVDISEKYYSGTPYEQLDWCRKKVTEADFVLVCISKKYLEDIASDTSTNSKEHLLHTKEIYEMMICTQQRGQHNSCDNSADSTLSPCLIPLLFPEMELNHIPPCMKNGPTYNWPKQYKDLAWVLTKPEERAKAKKETRDVHGETVQESAVEMDCSHFPADGVLCNS